MKKLVALVLSLVLVLGCLAACDNTGKETTVAATTTKGETAPPTTVETETGLTGDLSVLSFTNEVKKMLIAFKAVSPELNITYEEIPTKDGQFRQKALAIADTAECPDVLVLEAAFVKEFVDHESLLLDISDLKVYADELQTYANTIEVGTNYATGEIRAYSYQNTPGAVFYRRSLAKEYFGTDDPDAIQALMADWDKFTAMAATIKEKSAGKAFMLSSIDEFRWPFFANREDPWVVDDKLVIDPMIDELMAMALTFGENDYTAKANQWEDGWFAGMSDSLKDAAGNQIKIFAYFLPTWGLPYVLAPNAGDATKGDWACVPGPMAYQWGGTWVGVMKNAKNPVNAKAFVRFVALDATNLKNWATGVYTYEFLAAIDPEMTGPAGEGQLQQAAGDFVSSQKVVEEITSSFDNSEMSQFLGGQNAYSGFALAAPNCRADLFQASDEAIQNKLQEALRLYAYEGMSKEDMLVSFKDAVATDFPSLDVG